MMFFIVSSCTSGLHVRRVVSDKPCDRCNLHPVMPRDLPSPRKFTVEEYNWCISDLAGGPSVVPGHWTGCKACGGGEDNPDPECKACRGTGAVLANCKMCDGLGNKITWID